jgi:glycopeptide antibiotics resistance protein
MMRCSRIMQNRMIPMKKNSIEIAAGSSGTAKTIRICCTVLFILYILLLLYITMFSRQYGRGYTHRSINLIPFATISEYMNVGFNRRIIITNLLGNVAAFVPMGFLLPLASKRLSRFFRTAAATAGASLIIEIAQFIAGVGATDIDDIILNTIGGVFGFLMFLVCRMLYNTVIRRNDHIFY